MKKPKKISRSALFRTNPDIVFREEGTEALLFDPSTGSIKILNYVGKLVWKLLSGEHTEEEISLKVSKKFKNESRERIGKDVGAFIKKLKEYGYLGERLK